ncbi:MAG: hypothetical protein PHF86_00545 [Candidatus Nanoarchaeia archaeon]|nr:hypothetical protein [Candidatus Nanoarchaeia archaeon]
MEISKLLINKYKFHKQGPPKFDKHHIDTDKWDCGIRIHDLHWLFYSDEYKHFTIAVLNDNQRKMAGGRFEKWYKIMIPRPIYNEQDIKEVLIAFKLINNDL